MKKIYTAICMAFAVLAAVISEPVQARNQEPVLLQMNGPSVPNASDTRELAIPQARIFAPTYPVGMNGGESKLVEYSVSETGNVAGQLTSRTLQFFTQYDVPLGETMGPFPMDVPLAASQTKTWNELIYLPDSVVAQARIMKEYAIVLKTHFTGTTSSGAKFTGEARLLLLLPPAAFGKAIPSDGAIVQPDGLNLKWNSSVGAVEYQYCIDRINNNSCDTDWAGTYWLGTYDTNSFLRNLAPDEVYYWQVRAVNSAGATYANNGRFWKFTTQPAPPYLFFPTGGMLTDSRRPDFQWSGYYSALSYNIQISKTANFSQIILNATTNSPGYTPTVNLPVSDTLYWRVRFRNQSGFTQWSAVETFDTPAPPSIPVLESPAVNALDKTHQPIFNWKNSVCPLGSPAFSTYQIQVAEDADFSFTVLDEATTEGDISDSDFTPTISLSPNMKYYWRVRAINQDGQYSAWSTASYFRSAMVSPILMAPWDTEPLLDKRPALDWENVDGATGYKLVISRNANLSSPIKSITTVGSFYTFTSDLPANSLLYWRVQATGPNGPSSSSETWSFFTANPPSTPVLSSPGPNAMTRDYSPSFDWNNSAVPGNTTFMTYQIQADNEKDFSTPEIDTFTSFENVKDSGYTLDYDLDSNTLFYWRVRSYNNEMQYSAWSAVWAFRTAVRPPEYLNVTINPELPRKPTFDWYPVDGAASYSIQVSTSPTFRTLLVNAKTGNYWFTPVINLPTNTTLYWRVQTNGVNGPSDWTQTEFVIP